MLRSIPVEKIATCVIVWMDTVDTQYAEEVGRVGKLVIAIIIVIVDRQPRQTAIAYRSAIAIVLRYK